MASVDLTGKIHKLRAVRDRLAIIIKGLEALAQISPRATRRRNRKQAPARLKVKSATTRWD